MRSLKVFFYAFLVLFVFAGTAKGVAAATPRMALTPTSSTVNSGNTFTVTVGVDSGSEASNMIDVFGSFDATKLEIVSVTKATNPAFNFSDFTPNIDNNTGKFNFTCMSDMGGGLSATPIKGDLAVITFKGKSAGVASVNFTCQNGSTADTNIIKSGVDVVDCGANPSGSYTITASSNNNTTTTTTTSTTSNNNNQTTTELPKTGVLGATIGLVVFGSISLISALFLRFL